MRCAQPQRAEALVEHFQPEAAQDQVGGHVVAQGHHQLAQRVQPHLRLIAEEPQRPAGRHALLSPRLELFVPARFALLRKGRHRGKHRELDDAGGEKRLVLPHAELLARGKVLIIQSAVPRHARKLAEHRALQPPIHERLRSFTKNLFHYKAADARRQTAD